jgi:hypothetical protein
MSAETRQRLVEARAAEEAAWQKFERTHRDRHFAEWDHAMTERERAEDAHRRALSSVHRRRRAAA